MHLITWVSTDRTQSAWGTLERGHRPHILSSILLFYYTVPWFWLLSLYFVVPQILDILYVSGCTVLFLCCTLLRYSWTVLSKCCIVLIYSHLILRCKYVLSYCLSISFICCSIIMLSYNGDFDFLYIIPILASFNNTNSFIAHVQLIIFENSSKNIGRSLVSII